MKPMSLRLVVFDLDGTLVESKRDLADAINDLLAELGSPPLAEDSVALMVGDGARQLVRRALAATGLDVETPGALERFLRLYDERLLRHTRPYAGTQEMLARCAGRARLAVLTNKPTSATLRILRGLGLRDFFDGIIGGDTRFGRKPDPAGLQALVADAGTRAADTLLVGDSHVDVATARRARTRLCLARFGFGPVPANVEPTDFAIDTPAELIDVVERLADGARR